MSLSENTEMKRMKKMVSRNCKKKSGNCSIRREIFYFILSKIHRSKKNYEFLVKAGKYFQTGVFNFCKIMCEEEINPKSVKNTTKYMIFKSFIHSKNWFPLTVKACVVEKGLKGPLIDSLFSLNRPHWAVSVIESSCRSVRMLGCLSAPLGEVCFQDLSLALKSNLYYR